MPSTLNQNGSSSTSSPSSQEFDSTSSQQEILNFYPSLQPQLSVDDDTNIYGEVDDSSSSPSQVWKTP